MSGSSSSMRRKPRRTRLWSSTSNTVIFFSIRFRFRLGFLPGYGQVNQRSAFGWSQKNDLSAHQLCALAHGYEADAPPVGTLGKSGAMVQYFQLQRAWQETQVHRGSLGARVTG